MELIPRQTVVVHVVFMNFKRQLVYARHQDGVHANGQHMCGLRYREAHRYGLVRVVALYVDVARAAVNFCAIVVNIDPTHIGIDKNYDFLAHK